MDDFAEELIDETIFVLRVWAGKDPLPERPKDLVAMGASDPVRLFVKNEPHKLEKLKTGRVRLIASVPFHIVLAEMLLFRDQNEREITQWDRCPSKPGIGLACPSHVRRLWDSTLQSRSSGTLASNDMSGYDWSLSSSFFEAEAYLRVDLANGWGTVYERCVSNCFHSMCRCVVTLSDGRMFEQATPGVMWSGRYVTSSSDSRIRVLASRMIGSSFCYSMGDDALEEYLADAPERYLSIGLRCTDNVRCDDEFEFCSHIFRDGVAWTVNPAKILYNLLSQKLQTEELLAQFAMEVQASPDRHLLFDIVKRSGWGAQIHDGEEQN